MMPLLNLLAGISLSLAGAGFSHLGVGDGLSQASIFCSAQDADGNMWFGTYDGLNRYNGYEVRVYKNNPDNSSSIPGDKINRIFQDSRGRLWIITNCGAALYDKESDSFGTVYRENHHLVSDVAQLRQGTMLVGARTGVHWISEAGQQDFSSGLCWPEITDAVFAETPDGLYMGDREGALYFIRSDAGIPGAAPSKEEWFRAPAAVSDLLYLDDTLWVATASAGLFKIDPLARTTVHYEASGAGLCSNTIRCLCPDARNNIWIGTDRNISVYHSGDGSFETVKPDRDRVLSLSNGSIKCITRDNFGGMWIGTYFGGVNYYYPNRIRFHVLDTGDNPENNIMGGMAISPDGSILIGTNRNGLFCYEPQLQRNTVLQTGELDIKDIVVSADSSEAFICKILTGFGIYNYAEGSFRLLQGGGIPRNIYSLAETPEGNLLLGSLSGIFYYRRDDGRCFNMHHPFWRDYHPVSHIIKKQVLRDSLYYWVGSENSLYRFRLECDAAGVPSFADMTEFPSITMVEDIRVLPGDIIYIGTRRGLFCRDGAKGDDFRKVEMLSPMLSEIVRGIEEDASGRLWISTENGLCLYNPENGKLNIYTAKDGLPSNTFCTYSHATDANGRMYFGGLDGVVSFDPESVLPSEYSPTPVIDALSSFGTPLHLVPGEVLKLSHSQRDLELHFSVPDYVSWRESAFRYKLEGFDNDWDIADLSRKASWSNIPPGRYRFVLEAANSDGLWCSEPAVLKIRVRPHWLLSLPAVLAWSLMLCALIYFVIRHIVRRSERRHRAAMEELARAKQAEIDELRILAMRNQKEALVQRFSAGRQLSEGDTRLLMDAYSVVRQHIQDENFSVEQLSEALFMSRSSLHRKLKACTGGSALDFIRKVRFDQACVLLREGGLTIAEIAYKVGFSSPAYFSDAFKRFTGISPSTFSGLQQN